MDVFMEEKDNDELSIKLLQLCKRATIPEARVIRCIVYLLPGITIRDKTKSFEAAVITSYIHPIIRSMFADEFHRCYNANLNVPIDNQRPDYKVDSYDSYFTNSVTTVFGEIKSYHQSSNDRLLTYDFYRLGMFAKDCIDKTNYEGIFVFQAIENKTTFYLMKLPFDKTYVLSEVATINLPTTINELPNILLTLMQL